MSSSDILVPRRMWHLDAKGDRVPFSQAEILENTRPIVVLGEAGMGKSTLLKQIAEQPGFILCTARKLINSGGKHPSLRSAQVLVIDALDEFSSQRDGDAVNQTLRCLMELGLPRFVLSCRVADWRSAADASAVSEQYDLAPIEAHLEQLTKDDITTVLSARLTTLSAEQVINHYNERGLEGLLGNPQTLKMITAMAMSGKLPNSVGELFEGAIEQLWQEHNDQKAATQLTRQKAFEAAGAAFVALIVTGSEAISRVAASNVEEGELMLADLACLADAATFDAVLDTRLFTAVGADRFSYLHRRIGEFLAAAWLARRADTPRKRRRMLYLFHQNGQVPTSLRGVHAWLARTPQLAESVIAADPMGVIEYGDADSLGPSEGRALLNALRDASAANPDFWNWREYAATSLVQPALKPELQLLLSSSTEPWRLRLFILHQLRKAPTTAHLAPELHHLLMNKAEPFAIRLCAGQALARDSGVHDWKDIFDTLRQQGQEPSLRIAINLLNVIGCENFSDEYIAELVLSYLRQPDKSTILGPLGGTYPASRIPALLDEFAARPNNRDDQQESRADLYRLMQRLVSRAIEHDLATPAMLWRWLRTFHGASNHYGSTPSVSTMLEERAELRQGLQWHVLFELDEDQNVEQNEQNLRLRQNVPYPNENDVVALLHRLHKKNPADYRWQDLTELVQHDAQRGAAVRDAARVFAEHIPAKLRWLDSLTSRPPTEWEVRQAEDEARRNAENLRREQARRALYQKHLYKVQSGDFQYLYDPARIYLGEFSEIPSTLAPMARVEQWLSPEIAQAVKAGFDIFLRQQAPTPNAAQIADAIANSRFFAASYVLIAAAAERLASGDKLDDLSDERLQACYYSTCTAAHQGAPDFRDLPSQLIAEIKRRNLWQQTLRGIIEPQLHVRRQHVGPPVWFDEELDSEVVELVSEWLVSFPNLSLEVETGWAEFLIRHGIDAPLQQALYDGRSGTTPARQQLWNAVGLIIDFSATANRIDSAPIDPNLLWSIRHLQRATHPRAQAAPLLEWIITRFRPLYPYTSSPSASTGDENAWDASVFLMQVMTRLGSQTDAGAVNALRTMAEMPLDGYTEKLLKLVAEQSQLLVDANVRPISLASLAAITADAEPMDAADLQAFMLEELQVVQAKVKSDDTDSWRGFFDEKGPHGEERCRDALMGLLRQSGMRVTLSPEAHVRADKEVDIACEAGRVRMPIEIKGQWHKDLWHAADTQLDRLYTPDWRADGRGIYLVLWFGAAVEKSRRLRSMGRGLKAPATASELETMLRARSSGASSGRLAVFVLDLEQSQHS